MMSISNQIIIFKKRKTPYESVLIVDVSYRQRFSASAK